MDAIDLTHAREAANEGMQRALNAAERRDMEWPELALGFVRSYARTHQQFTVEQLTAEANRLGYGSPAADQAWGSIVRMAASPPDRIIEKTGAYAPRIKGHGSPAPVWRSLVYVGDVA